MSFQIRPIGPKSVKKVIPDFVIEAVNELINEKYTGGGFTIRQKEIKERVMSKTERDFDYAWMDFEPIYRAEGWHVDYDKPGFNEDYDAFFRFSEK